MPIVVTALMYAKGQTPNELGSIEIERLEELHDPEGTYMYRVTLADETTGEPGPTADFSHNREHSVWILIQKALLALAEKHHLPLDWGE